MPDPYKYFRVEAREILDGLAGGALALEKGAAGGALADHVARMMRLAHTLKGAARIVKQAAIADAAHAMEGLLAPQRDSAAPVARATVDRILQSIDAIATHLAAIDAPTGAAAAPAGTPAVRTGDASSQPLQTVRVDIAEMDELSNEIASAGIRLGGLRAPAASLALAERLAVVLANGGAGRDTADALLESIQSARREIQIGIDRSHGDMNRLLSRAHRARLVPVTTIFGQLERAARDTARSLGKEIVFEATAGDIRVEAALLEALRDALLHAVRNAVDHGIESPSARVAAGKPPAGRLEIRAQREAGRLVLTCHDDGAGLDLRAIAAGAASRGLIRPEAASTLDMDKAGRLVFAAGLTTSRSVTDVSGRGVGLDAAREAIQRLRGDVALASRQGQGTTLTFRAPVSLSSLPVLVVESGGVVAAIPLDSVPGVVWMGACEVSRSSEGDRLLEGGRALPLRRLSEILASPSDGDDGAPSAPVTPSAVLVSSGGRVAAVQVDRLLGTPEVILRPLPAGITGSCLLAGAAIDAHGDPQPVLDAAALVAAIHASQDAPARQADESPAAPPERRRERPATVLVIDDSLTTRMLEQSILQSAGYEVVLATSGEEGLRTARERPCDLFIVDVEMPGMSGFEFVSQTRDDASLRRTPAILLTSRSSPEEKLRGAQAGARDYIVKSEFDQARFLETIRKLTERGRPSAAGDLAPGAAA